MNWGLVQAFALAVVASVLSVVSTLGLLFQQGYLKRKGELTAEQEEALKTAVVLKLSEQAKAEGKAAGEAAATEQIIDLRRDIATAEAEGKANAEIANAASTAALQKAIEQAKAEGKAAGEAAVQADIVELRKGIAKVETQMKSQSPSMEWAHRQSIESFEETYSALSKVLALVETLDLMKHSEMRIKGSKLPKAFGEQVESLMSKVMDINVVWRRASSDIQHGPWSEPLREARGEISRVGIGAALVGAVLWEIGSNQELQDQMTRMTEDFGPRLKTADLNLIKARKLLLASLRGQ